MKLPYSVLVFLSSCVGFAQVKKKPVDSAGEAAAFYEFKAKTIDGEVIDFEKFRGKKVLIVNTASKCGFTPQYQELQRFHELHKDSVVVIGFPSNDFFNQEPGSESEIKEFCQKNFGVSFLLMEKVKVKGEEKHPVYEWLTDASQNGWNDREPKWNFSKYLVNQNGELVGYYAPAVSPLDEKVLEDLKK